MNKNNFFDNFLIKKLIFAQKRLCRELLSDMKHNFRGSKKNVTKIFFTQTNNVHSFFEKRARTSVGLVVESRESRPKAGSSGFPRPVPHFSARSFSKKEKRKKVSLLYQNVGCSKWSLDFCSSPTIGFTSLSGMVK